MTVDVITQARAVLAASPIQALRELRVEQAGTSLILSGRVGSFYHKQLAQEVVRLIARDMRIVNTIDVNYNEGPAP